MAETADSTASACQSKATESGAELRRQEYVDYLKSESWFAKRREFFKAKKPKKCYVCGKPRESGFHVHHTTYERFGNECVESDLVLVCPPCHDEIHKFHKENQYTLKGATDRVRYLSIRARMKASQKATKKRSKARKERRTRRNQAGRNRLLQIVQAHVPKELWGEVDECLIAMEVPPPEDQATLPSPADIMAAKKGRGGWTRAQLAAWGVPWPPPRGWRERLILQYEEKKARERQAA